MSVTASTITRAETCIVACAEAWRGDGEILASPFGTIPAVGARLARETFSPSLLLTDGEATLVAGAWPVGEAAPGPVESWMPFRQIFDLAWRGRRHVMMIPTQLDRYGNANISCIGDFARPKVQLLGVRGAPGNTVHHPTSYWIPRHTPRALVASVDMVCGVGYDRSAQAGPAAQRFHDLRRVVTDLAVLDFATEDRTMRLASVHPGVAVEDVVAATGFPIVLPDDVPQTRAPDEEELRLIREVLDPKGLRDQEVAG